jgi:hypothetical protein
MLKVCSGLTVGFRYDDWKTLLRKGRVRSDCALAAINPLTNITNAVIFFMVYRL